MSAAPAGLRPLPSRPNLEFEHKEAKALLRRLRAGDPEALTRARARHPVIDASKPKLADAQLVIAREYGFTSWPKLVRYFDEASKQTWHSSLMRPEDHEAMVRTLLIEHRSRRIWTARSLQSFVPRFYGLPIADIFAAAVTEDEARLAFARGHGFPSWQVMREYTAEHLHVEMDRGDADPHRLAFKAMEAGDLAELRRLAAAHSEILRPSEYFASIGGRILGSALHLERKNGSEAMRPIIEWLVSQGLDVQLELNMRLCDRGPMPPDKLQWLLDRGADPNWVAPNGFPVLEHALLRLHGAEAVDLLAKRVVPRKALWIAAGLGDVDGVRRSLDAKGRPTKAATRLRPPFGIAGPFMSALNPDPDDEELLVEAFLVAMINRRTNVLEYLVSRDFPLNTMSYGSPLINVAVGSIWPDVAACLVRCGADLDLRGWRPNSTAREIAVEHFLDNPADTDRRRIVELVGLAPAKLLADRDARAAR